MSKSANAVEEKTQIKYPDAIIVRLSYLEPIFPMNGVHAMIEISNVLYKLLVERILR